PTARGVGLLLQEGGVPVRLRSCYLDDLDLAELAGRAEALRGATRTEAPTLRLLDGPGWPIPSRWASCCPGWWPRPSLGPVLAMTAGWSRSRPLATAPTR